MSFQKRISCFRFFGLFIGLTDTFGWDWREIAGDELQVGVEGNQTEEIGTDSSVGARTDGPETDGQPVQQKTIVEKA